jgi:hypothetical protein
MAVPILSAAGWSIRPFSVLPGAGILIEDGHLAGVGVYENALSVGNQRSRILAA